MEGVGVRRLVFEAEHEEFRSSVRAVLQRDLVPHIETTREAGMISRDVWRTLGEHGFLGFMVPEEYGGGGMHDSASTPSSARSSPFMASPTRRASASTPM